MEESMKGDRCSLVAEAVLVVVLLGGSYANAADQGVTGKMLLLKTPSELVLLSTDDGIGVAGSDPVGGADSSITFDDGSGPVTLSLPASLWRANGSGRLFKYKDTGERNSPAVKIAQVKAGLLAVVAKGLPFPVPNGAATVDVVLRLDGGTNAYCMTFSGTGDGEKFLVKDAPAGSCPLPPTPTPTPTPTATATATPTSTPAPQNAPCGDSQFPSCGGACPIGETCQAVQELFCDFFPCDSCTITLSSCGCVPETSPCDGYQGAGICNPPGSISFSFGPCPPGEVCLTATNGFESTRECSVPF